MEQGSFVRRTRSFCQGVTILGTNVSNAYEEARALASRRVRWILNRELDGIRVRAEVLALRPPDYDVYNRWRQKKRQRRSK
jgi:hypothetical protein